MIIELSLSLELWYCWLLSSSPLCQWCPWIVWSWWTICIYVSKFTITDNHIIITYYMHHQPIGDCTKNKKRTSWWCWHYVNLKSKLKSKLRNEQSFRKDDNTDNLKPDCDDRSEPLTLRIHLFKKRNGPRIIAQNLFFFFANSAKQSGFV